MSKSTVLGVLLVATNLSSVACACSCFPGATLQRQYEQADTIVIAKISGCAADRLSRQGYCHSHGWTFETVENLKGTHAAVRVQSSDASPVRSSCDLSLKVGDTYVLFLSDGRTYQCSGTGSLSDENGARKLRDVEVLRAYRDGAIPRITDPWYFSDSGWECEIDHHFDGAYLLFSYLYGLPPHQQGAAAPSNPVPNVTLSLVQPFELVEPPLFQVGDERVSLTRTLMRPPGQPAFSLDGLHGDSALALLDTMSEPTEVVVSGTRRAADVPAQPFRATTHTAAVRELAAQFKACIASHAGSSKGHR
jgi:hypothetical protein